MVKTEIHSGVGRLVFDLPGRSMNVLEPEGVAALSAAFEKLVADPSVKGIVIASGKSSFIAGADLAQMAPFARPGTTPQQAMDGLSYLSTFFRRIETCGKPVVAAASGTALGGGLELMLACHYRIAADNPKGLFGLPEVGLGLLPGAGGTQRVPRLIGIAKSLPILTSGKPMRTAEALKSGLLHEVVPPDALIASAERAIREGRVNPVASWDVKGYKLPGGDAYAPANAAALGTANSSLHARTRGNYPAPLAILRCVYEGSKLPIDTALKLELKFFAQLVQSRVAQNLIRTQFFARQAADKLARRPKNVPPSAVKTLGMLGAGFMGAGIAQVSAQTGIDVVLVDRSRELAQRGYDHIARALAGDVEKGRISATARDALLAHIRVADSTADFSGCDLVVEAVLEDMETKRAAIRSTEAAMGEDAIFASNTSALPIDDLAQASVRPQHLIGLHFFSPVPKMALVEVVVGKATSDETLARALDYVRQIRKTPIVVHDGYGFYTTRCVDAYIREGLQLLLDGVAPALIENAGMALGMPVGPLALADEVGIDVMHHIAHFFRSRENGDWADDRHRRPNALLDRLVAEKRYGRKTGAGFYVYPADAPKHLDVQLPVAAEQPSPETVRERLLYAQVLEAARCRADGVVTDDAEADLGANLGWAFPSYLGGPLATLDAIGTAAFVVRCDQLVKRCGARFEVPGALRKTAAAA